MRSLPLIAILLGLAGLIPFLAAGLGALNPDVLVRGTAQLGLLAYGAVILSFLGAVHWGMGLAEGDRQPIRAQRLRFGLGVVPALIGWVALLTPFAGMPWAGLLLLAAGFFVTTVAEARATTLGWLPRGYMRLRWVLSVVVVVCLVTVCVVLALGGRVAV